MYYDIVESGKRIKELRKKIGFTQETFAIAIGISHRTYAGIESGRHGTSIETLVEMVHVLGCTLDYLVMGKEELKEDIISKLLHNLSEDKKKLALRLFKGILENI